MRYFLVMAIAMTSNATFSSDLIEVIEKESYLTADALKWENFKTDLCQMFNTVVRNEEELRALGLRRCKDNSISFVQPKSVGVGGWEGKCGQTFGANSIYSLCRIGVNPETYFKRYFRDLTPGVRPSTLKRGMNKLSRKLDLKCFTQDREWEYETAYSSDDFITRVEESLKINYSLPSQIEIRRNGESYLRNPVGALIMNPGGKYLHWVSIVDIIKNQSQCSLVVNHWDNQYEVPCTTFSSWSKNVGMTYPIILKSYSLITYK